MDELQKKGSIIKQVALLFFIGVLTTGFLTFYIENRLSGSSVTRQTEVHASEISDEVSRAVREYPAYTWLLRYWYSHYNIMNIEYDAVFSPKSLTAEKCRQLAKKHPDLELKYASEDQLQALPEEDRKLYAEVAYSWLITRINEIKRAHHIDYLFCVVTNRPYDTQFFMMSAADPGAVRGTNYEEVYPLGHRVTVSESQQQAMESALANSSHLANAGNYVDYYSTLCKFDGHEMLIGMTYSLADLRNDIDRQTWTGTVCAILNQVSLSLICLLLIYLFVLRPLKEVQQNIRLYKSTKDSETVIRDLKKIRSKNEIRELSEDIISLASEIDDYTAKIQTITAEKERINTELSLATRIQVSMLPHIFPAFPHRSDFDIHAIMTPAKAVGGDFYDFFLIDEDHLCMVMADVSGKGVPAALFMMISKTIIQNCAVMLGMDPAKVLEKTNGAVCSNNPEQMFVTVWIGILELSTGRLCAANAGHEYPAIMHNGTFSLFKDKHGFVIGGLEGASYKSYDLYLQPGDKLFLYTDGVPEAAAADKEMFGIHRMLNALNTDPSATPKQVLKNVRKAVDAFVKDEEQFDDMTMLCLEYKGKEL